MAGEFAAIESATADNAVAALANCTATVGAVSGVPGIFDSAYADPLGMASSTPVLMVSTADVPAVAQDTAVVVGGVNYTVASVEPDGTGMTLLRLQEAS